MSSDAFNGKFRLALIYRLLDDLQSRKGESFSSAFDSNNMMNATRIQNYNSHEEQASDLVNEEFVAWSDYDANASILVIIIFFWMADDVTFWVHNFLWGDTNNIFFGFDFGTQSIDYQCSYDWLESLVHETFQFSIDSSWKRSINNTTIWFFRININVINPSPSFRQHTTKQ